MAELLTPFIMFTTTDNEREHHRYCVFARMPFAMITQKGVRAEVLISLLPSPHRVNECGAAYLDIIAQEIEAEFGEEASFEHRDFEIRVTAIPFEGAQAVMQRLLDFVNDPKNLRPRVAIAQCCVAHANPEFLAPSAHGVYAARCCICGEDAVRTLTLTPSFGEDPMTADDFYLPKREHYADGWARAVGFCVKCKRRVERDITDVINAARRDHRDLLDRTETDWSKVPAGTKKNTGG